MLRASTNKNLRLPKYLTKRKIELIRKKICLRKYAYVWYRMTISNILPSTAVKHYKDRLKRKILNKWRGIWFDKNILWKLEIRADFHYKLSLKQKFIKKWLYFCLEKKQMQLKIQIAEKFYERKLKIRYYLRLKNAKQAIKINNEYRTLIEEHMTYLYLNFNFLHCFQEYESALELYLLNVLFKRNYKRRMFKKCFRKLLYHAKRSVYKKHLYYKSKCFFTRKYRIKIIMKYFDVWKQYVLFRREKKRKTKLALKHFGYKLMQKCFQKIILYTDKRILKNNTRRIIRKYSEEKLIIKCLHQWKFLVVEQQQNRFKKDLADNHCEIQLKQKCFMKLKKYKTQRTLLRIKLSLYCEAKKLKLLRLCFDKLRHYSYYSQLKKEKYFSAQFFYKRNLQERCLMLLRKYVKHKQAKRLQLEDLTKQAKRKTMKHFFRKWKYFIKYTATKKKKKTIAQIHYNTFLLRYYLRELKKFVAYRKLQKFKQKLADQHLMHKLKMFAFSKWTEFLGEQRYFKRTLMQAKQFYNNNLEKLALRIILEAGFSKAQEMERNALDKVLKKYKNVYRYFNIWKDKTVKKKEVHRKPTNTQIFEMFQWNPRCFEPPRVPEFLKYKMQHL